MHLGASQKAVQNSYFAENLYPPASVKKEFHDTHYLGNFLEFQKHARLKAIVCRSEIY